MICTVTAVVSTIVSSTAANSLVVALGAVGVFTLIASLMIKVVADHGAGKFRLFGHNLVIVILPLLLVIFYILLVKVGGILT